MFLVGHRFLAEKVRLEVTVDVVQLSDWSPSFRVFGKAMRAVEALQQRQGHNHRLRQRQDDN